MHGDDNKGSSRKVITPINEEAIREEAAAEESRQANLPSRYALNTQEPVEKVDEAYIENLLAESSKSPAPKKLHIVVGMFLFVVLSAVITLVVLTTVL
jgi:hypothetical protein